MKRNVEGIEETKSTVLSNPITLQLRPYTNQCKVISSSLNEDFKREELVALMQDARGICKVAERLLSLECCRIACEIPEEIWKKIFSTSTEKPAKGDDEIYFGHSSQLMAAEMEFRKFACVSKLWFKLIDELVPIYFRGTWLMSRSNWILLKFRNANVEKLDLSNSTMGGIIDSTLRQITSLRKLDLCGNSLITSFGLESLTNLTKLDLSDNDRISCDCLEKLTNIKSLILFDNKKVKFAKSLQKLPYLESMRVTATSGILPVLKYFTNLKKLIVESNEFIEQDAVKDLLQDTITRLVNLRTLDLTRYSSFSCQDLRKLSNLTSLTVRQNKVITNDDLSVLTNLRFLAIESKNISGVGVSSLTNLTQLRCMQSPNIHEDAFKNLTLLREVCLHRDIKITYESFRNLTNLTTIYFSAPCDEYRSRQEELDQLKKILPNLSRLVYQSFRY